MLYLTCTTITSVDLAHYGVSRAKDWVSVDCGTITSKGGIGYSLLANRCSNDCNTRSLVSNQMIISKKKIKKT